MPSKAPYPVSVKSKVCVKCQILKPAESFYPAPRMRSGLNSWCKACQIERSSKYRQQNTNDNKANNELGSKWADPLAYSRFKCLHVADFTRSAIERFERATGVEAPPHLTSIYQLAMSLAEQHPEERNHTRPFLCVRCRKTFDRKPRQTPRCAECQAEYRREQERARFQRLKQDRPKYEARLAQNREYERTHRRTKQLSG